MSLGTDGKQIRCDGEGCRAVAALPVALRRQLIPLQPGLPEAEGWLFINSHGDCRHFCPLCSPQQLNHIALAPDYPPQKSNEIENGRGILTFAAEQQEHEPKRSEQKRQPRIQSEAQELYLRLGTAQRRQSNRRFDPERGAYNMNQAAPAIQNLARRLLALEADGSEQAEAMANAALGALTKLRIHLTKLVGIAGFEALLARALALARAEAVWLGAVRVQADGSLKGFSEAARQQSADAVTAGCRALMAQLLGLLVTFIGEALTLRLMQEVWPEARLDNTNAGAEERPE